MHIAQRRNASKYIESQFPQIDMNVTRLEHCTIRTTKQSFCFKYQLRQNFNKPFMIGAMSSASITAWMSLR